MITCLMPSLRLLKRHLKEQSKFSKEAMLVFFSDVSPIFLVSLNAKSTKKKPMQLQTAPAPKLP